MAVHPDPILAQADVATLVAERSDLHAILVRGLYGHLRDVQQRQPTLEEAREYIERVTRHVDLPTLWEQLGLPAPDEDEAAEPTAALVRPTVPRRGRPKGSRTVPRDQVVEVFRSLRVRHGRRPTQAQLAANLTPRIAPRTLQGLLAEYGLPWPIE